MTTVTEQNKSTVIRFNKEFIEQGNVEAFYELMSPSFINRTAPAGISKGMDGMLYFINDVLRKSFTILRVDILDQIAEDDKVTTRKAIHLSHTGIFMNVF